MEEEVIFQIRVLAETAGADVAFKRPGSTVNVHVRFQVSGSREWFGAEGALVRLFLYKIKKMSLDSYR